MFNQFGFRAPTNIAPKFSPATPFYNCIAWAVHVQNRVIWPDEDEQHAWPSDLPRDESLVTMQLFFNSLGFTVCSDGTFVEQLEKVAVYANGSVATHAARQCHTGDYARLWTSKLGSQVDIHHKSAIDIENGTYGKVAMYMSRPFDGKPPKLPRLHPPQPRLVNALGGVILK